MRRSQLESKFLKHKTLRVVKFIQNKEITAVDCIKRNERNTIII